MCLAIGFSVCPVHLSFLLSRCLLSRLSFHTFFGLSRYRVQYEGPIFCLFCCHLYRTAVHLSVLLFFRSSVWTVTHMSVASTAILSLSVFRTSVRPYLESGAEGGGFGGVGLAGGFLDLGRGFVHALQLGLHAEGEEEDNLKNFCLDMRQMLFTAQYSRRIHRPFTTIYELSLAEKQG